MPGLLDRLLAPWRAPAPLVFQPAQEITSEWQLVVPFTEAIAAGALAAGVVVGSAPVSLLGFDRPTMMQEWRLFSISVPVGVSFTQGAGEHPNAVVTVTATLRRAGDPVWTASGSTERGSGGVSNLVLTDRLAPPVVVRAGQRLTLELAASCYEALTGLTVLLAGRFSGVAQVPADGAIDYQAVAFTGHRQL